MPHAGDLMQRLVARAGAAMQHQREICAEIALDLRQTVEIEIRRTGVGAVGLFR